MRKLFIILLLVGLWGCNEENKQYKILKPEEFENMMYEVHVADAMLKHKNASDRKVNSVYKSYYNHIFLKYQMTPNDFEANVRKYSVETEEYKAMYDRILNKLVNEKNKLQQVDTTEKTLKKIPNKKGKPTKAEMDKAPNK